MLLSVFTPTHKTTWLTEAYQSLVRQTNTEWEWVLAPNNGAEIPAEIASDSRVKVRPLPFGDYGIGALKKFACGHCTGELLVELDHDDLLAPNCLEVLAKTHAERNAGFYYSDFVRFDAAGKSRTYDTGWGWRNYPVNIDGKPYTANVAFAPCPGSIHTLHYGPHHVRAWQRDEYLNIGGHDPGLSIWDDYDLFCRTYLGDRDFVHINQALYLQREHTDNASDKVTKAQDSNFHRLQTKYTHLLVAAWCRRNSLRMLDLRPDGMPLLSPQGFEPLIPSSQEVLTEISDGSVGCVRAVNFLDFCRRGPHLVALLNEVYRILAPGGWFITKTPTTDGRSAFMNPLQQSGWNSNSFWCLTKRTYQERVPGLHARFQEARLWDSFDEAWHKDRKIFDVNCDLVALKGQRTPGWVEI